MKSESEVSVSLDFLLAVHGSAYETPGPYGFQARVTEWGATALAVGNTLKCFMLFFSSSFLQLKPQTAST